MFVFLCFCVFVVFCCVFVCLCLCVCISVFLCFCVFVSVVFVSCLAHPSTTMQHNHYDDDYYFYNTRTSIHPVQSTKTKIHTLHYKPNTHTLHYTQNTAGLATHGPPVKAPTLLYTHLHPRLHPLKLPLGPCRPLFLVPLPLPIHPLVRMSVWCGHPPNTHGMHCCLGKLKW